MFNDSFTIGTFTEGTPTARWTGYEDEAIWRRIEQFIHWRWGERSVEWVIAGQGLFVPPLRPVTITTVEKFNDFGSPAVPPGEWFSVTPSRSPFGICLRNSGYYRLKGTAGQAVTPPADVLEAYTRMADYIAAVQDEDFPGATTVTESVPGVSLSVRRPSNSMARALEYSGAMDILKAYRNA